MPTATDPMARVGTADESPLFGTRHAAGLAAAMSSRRRYAQILALLVEEPRTLWQCAAALGVTDNRISGRFSELARELMIERTGQTRPNPSTGCPADVWRIRQAAAATTADPAGEDEADRRLAQAERLADLAGYPTTLRIGDEMYDRGVIDPADELPGVAYVRRPDAGGVRQVVRVSLPECPSCGRPIRQVAQPTPGASPSSPSASRRHFRCPTPACPTWSCLLVYAPGHPPMLALTADR